MLDRRQLRLLVPQSLRRVPADLAGVLGLTVLTLAVIFVPVVRDTPLRVVLGLPFLLFIPGYAILAALFPEAGTPPTTPDTKSTDGLGEAGAPSETVSGDEEIASHISDRGIDGVERAALSFGLSIAVVPLIGLVLDFTPWGLGLVPVAAALTLVIVVSVAIATGRRRQLPHDERFRVPYREWMATARGSVFDADSRTDAALNVLLAVSFLLAISTITFAVAVPPQGEQFTELYLVTEDDDGELVADGYPEEMVLGESEPLVLGIENNERDTTDYTVIVQLQAVDTDGNESQVTEREQLDRFDTTLAHNETVHHEHDLEPTMTGENLRVEYLLYRGDSPDEPTRENAYRSIHIWLDVNEANGTG